MIYKQIIFSVATTTTAPIQTTPSPTGKNRKAGHLHKPKPRFYASGGLRVLSIRGLMLVNKFPSTLSLRSSCHCSQS